MGVVSGGVGSRSIHNLSAYLAQPHDRTGPLGRSRSMLRLSLEIAYIRRNGKWFWQA